MKKSLSKQGRILTAGILLASIATAGFWLINKQGDQNKTSTINPVVKIALVQEADQNMPLEVSGFVRGENRADVSPMVSGTIIKIMKHEGESVKKGEILAIIKSDQTDAQVAAANSQVSALEKTLSDSKKYYDQLVGEAKTARDSSPSDSADEAVRSAQKARDLQIQATKDQLVQAQGVLDVTRAGRNDFNITAPFSGTITNVYVREGGFANFSMPFLSISTPDSLEMETYVSAAEGKNISVGSIANLKSPEGLPLYGKVSAVSAGSDSSSFKTLIRIHIESPTDTVALGDFLSGQILIPRRNKAVSISRSAIVSRGGDQIVFTLDENNVAKEQTIKVVSENNGLVDVSEGLGIGQKIVVEGQQYLVNGQTTSIYATK